jgi:hypothetical protein
MLHLLLAGIVMISGSQTTSTSTSHGRIDPVHGGTILKVGVQTTHATQLPLVNRFRGVAGQPLGPNAIPQYCFVRKDMNGMPVVVFVRVESRQNAGACQPWTLWP